MRENKKAKIISVNGDDKWQKKEKKERRQR